MRPKVTTVPSSSLESVAALLISGVGCLAVGLTSLTGLIPDFPPNYLFIAAGGGFLLLSLLLWTCRAERAFRSTCSLGCELKWINHPQDEEK